MLFRVFSRSSEARCVWPLKAKLVVTGNGNQRFLIQFSVGTMPHDKIMRSIELYGTEVAPAVRRALAARTPSTAVGS